MFALRRSPFPKQYSHKILKEYIETNFKIEIVQEILKNGFNALQEKESFMPWLNTPSDRRRKYRFTYWINHFEYAGAVYTNKLFKPQIKDVMEVKFSNDVFFYKHPKDFDYIEKSPATKREGSSNWYLLNYLIIIFVNLFEQ